jgi:hypothetical protein
MTTLIANGLKDMTDYFDRLGDIANQAARMSINDIAQGTGLRLLRNAAYEEVNFPAGYLNNDRLFVSSRASNAKLEAVIKGRDRATSLARFAAKGQTPKSTRGSGVRVNVKRAAPKEMKGAWLVSLNNGNLGLAVRLSPGEQLRNKKTPSNVQIAPGVFLLYGPSVDQVFKGVAFDNADKIGEMVAVEFLRQIRRLTDA